MRLPGCGRLRTAGLIRRRHRLAGGRKNPADAVADDRPCDPASTRTKPPADPWTHWPGHREHRSTSARSWSFLFPAPALVLACHRRAAYRSRKRIAAKLRPAAPSVRSSLLPTRPAWSVPDPLLAARRFPTADIAASDRRTSRPAHAPASQVLPCHARSVASPPVPVRFVHRRRSSASDAPGELL